LIEIGDCSVEVASQLPGDPAVSIGINEFGIPIERTVKILDGAGKIADANLADTSVAIEPWGVCAFALAGDEACAGRNARVRICRRVIANVKVSARAAKASSSKGTRSAATRICKPEVIMIAPLSSLLTD
jgi:hypothetical protein